MPNATLNGLPRLPAVSGPPCRHAYRVATPLAPSTFRHAAGVITTCLVLVLVLQPLALLVPFLGPLATVFFFLRWWVFPYDAVYPSASLASNGTPTGPPLGHGVSVVQWLVLALLFAALARKAPRISVIGYAIGMIVLVPLATHFLLPVLGLRFYLAGP